VRWKTSVAEVKKVISSPINSLFPGETVVRRADAPLLEYFVPGQAEKPLLVFVPGFGHLARIAYGGHPGACPESFLGHWLGKAGFSFLGLSYPLETKEPVFDELCPSFDAQIWGKQIAESAMLRITEHSLSQRIILVVWSMGGKCVQPAYESARALGLEMHVVALAATPGLPGLGGVAKRLPMAASGYVWTPPNLLQDWCRQISSRTNAIPQNVYFDQYTGNGPVAIAGCGELYSDGRFVMDPMTQAQSYGAFAVDTFPLTAVLTNDDPDDVRHALADRGNWALLNGNGLVHRYLQRYGSKESRISTEGWTRLLDISRSLTEQLCRPVKGNHFFFVGESGARDAATALIEAIECLKQTEVAIEEALSQALQSTPTPLCPQH
jgi:hypothetical protein